MPSFDSDVVLDGAHLVVHDSGGREVFRFNPGLAALYVGASGGGNEGDLILRDGSGREVIQVDGALAALYLGAREGGNEGDLIVRDNSGREVFHVDGERAALYLGAREGGNEGDLIVRDDAGVECIRLDGRSGDIQLMGADLAEDFDSVAEVAPGSVLIAVGPDEVAVADSALDHRVIGVAAGACDSRPALRLATRRRGTGNGVPVSLIGRVHCWADASRGAIAAGDLLTTSPMAGHAMRVDEPAAAVGAILGKALAPLAMGTGLIPILLTLQ